MQGQKKMWAPQENTTMTINHALGNSQCLDVHNDSDLLQVDTLARKIGACDPANNNNDKPCQVLHTLAYTSKNNLVTYSVNVVNVRVEACVRR